MVGVVVKAPCSDRIRLALAAHWQTHAAPLGAARSSPSLQAAWRCAQPPEDLLAVLSQPFPGLAAQGHHLQGCQARQMLLKSAVPMTLQEVEVVLG